MNIKPALGEAILCRGERPYSGPIEPGDVFAWEPDLPHARELVVVSRIERQVSGAGYQCRVWCRRIDGTEYFDGRKEVYNPEDVFRAAVVPTRFKRFPPHPADALPTTPLPLSSDAPC